MARQGVPTKFFKSPVDICDKFPSPSTATLRNHLDAAVFWIIRGLKIYWHKKRLLTGRFWWATRDWHGECISVRSFREGEEMWKQYIWLNWFSQCRLQTLKIFVLSKRILRRGTVIFVKCLSYFYLRPVELIVFELCEGLVACVHSSGSQLSLTFPCTCFWLWWHRKFIPCISALLSETLDDLMILLNF